MALRLLYPILRTRSAGSACSPAAVPSKDDALPVDAAVAREYGRLAATVAAAGRQPRARVMDLLIAATAAAYDAALYTRNPDGLRGIDQLLLVIAV